MGRLREPVLSSGCKPVGDIVKCPGRFDSEPGLSAVFISEPVRLCLKNFGMIGLSPCQRAHAIELLRQS